MRKPLTAIVKTASTILFSLGWAQVAYPHVEGGQAAGFIIGLQQSLARP